MARRRRVRSNKLRPQSRRLRVLATTVMRIRMRVARAGWVAAVMLARRQVLFHSKNEAVEAKFRAQREKAAKEAE